jgi:hypothetical protein
VTSGEVKERESPRTAGAFLIVRRLSHHKSDAALSVDGFRAAASQLPDVVPKHESGALQGVVAAGEGADERREKLRKILVQPILGLIRCHLADVYRRKQEPVRTHAESPRRAPTALPGPGTMQQPAVPAV